MEMKQVKCVEIIIEVLMEICLIDVFDCVGVIGYMILLVFGGSGWFGCWS